MIYLLLFLGFVLQGCGSDSSVDATEFQPYVTKFLTNAKLNSIDTQIRFTTTYEANTALSWSNAGCDQKQNLIVIKQSFWKGLNDTEKELVIFHELGHCVLHKQHELSLNPDGSPTSIMYPNAIQLKNYYTEHYNEYISELFGSAK